MPADILYRADMSKPPDEAFIHYDDIKRQVVAVIKQLDHVTLVCNLDYDKYSQYTANIRLATKKELLGDKVEEVKEQPPPPKFRDDLPKAERPHILDELQKGAKKIVKKDNQSKLF